MLAKPETNYLELEYSRILACCNDQPNDQSNDETLACMLSSWQAGGGELPDDFGLGADGFEKMLATHFPGLKKQSLKVPVRKHDKQRDDERDEVCQLMLRHRANISESETCMATIVATACQASDHLWQDLGLWSRNQLSELMMRNFPALALKNDKNMKWKKFLYKQLCITEGIYTCRAPSCEVCADYDSCFAPED